MPSSVVGGDCVIGARSGFLAKRGSGRSMSRTITVLMPFMSLSPTGTRLRARKAGGELLEVDLLPRLGLVSHEGRFQLRRFGARICRHDKSCRCERLHQRRDRRRRRRTRRRPSWLVGRGRRLRHRSSRGQEAREGIAVAPSIEGGTNSGRRALAVARTGSGHSRAGLSRL